MSQLLGDCVDGATSWGRQEGRLPLQDLPALSQESLNPSGPQWGGSQLTWISVLNVEGSFYYPGNGRISGGRSAGVSF